MASPDKEYDITGQMKFNQYNPATGEVREGWQISYVDHFTKVASRVFVPTTNYPQGVNEAIMSEIADIRLVHTMKG